MAKHLPSLSALRAFEATARHLSFTRAAAELNLTQTAISHRLKELESLLGVQLFVRRQNAVSLTDDGRHYLARIRPALAQIANATDGISATREMRLEIRCLSAFAIRCLMPALPAFSRAHPEVGVHVTPISVSEPWHRDDFDVGIWHGVDDWPGFETRRLGEDEIFPVCSPALLQGAHPLREVADLRHHTILRTLSPIITDEWADWLHHAGVREVSPGNEIHCDALFLSLEAAISGVGLCMGRRLLVEADLAAGRLVEPFGLRLKSERAYFAVTPEHRSKRPHVRAFVDWLLDYFGQPAGKLKQPA